MKSCKVSSAIICGYFVGVLCLVVKIFLNFLVCYFHIHNGYKEEKSLEISCIAMSVGFGISALHNFILMIVKGKNVFKVLTKPLWMSQYILSALASICFIEFIEIDEADFKWAKSVLPVVLLSLEFIFYKTFVEPKYNKESPFEAVIEKGQTQGHPSMK